MLYPYLELDEFDVKLRQLAFELLVLEFSRPLPWAREGSVSVCLLSFCASEASSVRQIPV